MDVTDHENVLQSTALWLTGPAHYAHRTAPLIKPKVGELLIETLFSGVSRGTERLVCSAGVPQSEYERMRAPFQDGAFPYPVKYGYANVGRVIDGDAARIGTRVFSLFPHQDRFVIPASETTEIPPTIPSARATLVANMETALNALWDAGLKAGDSIAIIGGGLLGLLIGRLAARHPGTEVFLIDPRAEVAAIAPSLGITYAAAADHTLHGSMDLVVHTSATAAGLETAIDLAGFEATIAEVSWFGSKPATISLGGAFHSQRLTLRSTQVGQVATANRARWTYARRLSTALTLLNDPALDGLISHQIAFNEAASALPDHLLGAARGHGIVIRYPAANAAPSQSYPHPE